MDPKAPPRTAKKLPELLVLASAGSSWASLLVAIQTKPGTFKELAARIVPIYPLPSRSRAFDACCDAWAIYCDGLENGLEL